MMHITPQSLIRELKEADLRRFDFYASRVTRLLDHSCPSREFVTLDEEFRQVLASHYHRAGRPAFPNLKNLECGSRLRGEETAHDSPNSHSDSLSLGWSLFINPRLERLSVSIKHWASASPCLSMIPNACTNLREFDVVISTWNDQMARWFTGVVYALRYANVPLPFQVRRYSDRILQYLGVMDISQNSYRGTRRHLL